MNTQVRIWAPILKGNDEPTMSLAVANGSKPPNRQQYKQYLVEAIEELVKANPKEAQQDFESLDQQINPEFLNIVAMYPRSEWAAQVSLSDRMEMLLSRIDWQKDSPIREMSAENLPRLIDLLQQL